MPALPGLEPFDITYRLVTEQIHQKAHSLPDAVEAHWLHALMIGFLREYENWDDPKYGEHWRRFSRLRPRLLRFGCRCAYLHISYDLPRVIADNWPGVVPWMPTPTEDRGRMIYFGLTPIFLDVFSKVARKRRVVGGWAPIFWLVPRKATSAAAHWSLHLRTASWIHADNLRAGGRRLREQKMLEAMTAALEDVSSMPWSAGLLFPPHDAALKSVFPPLVPVLDAVREHSAMTGLIAAGLAVVLGSWWRSTRRNHEITRFINELGARVLEYITAAIVNPDGFERYRLIRTGRGNQT